MEELTGKISGVLYEKRETGFFILKVMPEGSSAPIRVKGSFPGLTLSAGLKAKFHGKYEEHATYGRQFNAATCEVVPEKGKAGIVMYLTKHVRSIGAITASRLYSVFGDELLHILETDPEQIRSLDFLTGPQAEAICREWKESSETRTAAIFLTDLGLNSSQVRSVFNRFGTQTREVVRGDPYRLADCAGVGFATADGAARKVGIGVNDKRRVRAFVLFVLSELASSDGHMYATSGQIQEHARKMFRRHHLESFSHGEYISESDFYSALADLKGSNQVVCSNDRIYLEMNWRHESTAADFMAQAVVQPPFPFNDLEETLAAFESEHSLALSDEQRQAFMLLSESRVCVVSGFPGTGKTLLISAFVHLFEKFNINYSLMSPTGIAAKRLSQVSGKTASTIHRALGFNRDGGWEFNAHNKFVADAVIVDEMSMVDGATFYNLISALSPTTVLVLVGDSAQLPSVGAGYVLNNLMLCLDVPHIALTRIYRQAKKSDIVSVSHSILHGETIDTRFNKDSEFVFLPYSRDQVVKEICDMAACMKAKSANFQVIAPMYNGDLGVHNLNVKLREVLNPDYAAGKAAKLNAGKHLADGQVDFYEGDRIMVVKNDYDRMIFNGDVGKIQRISSKNDEVEVKVFEWFDHESPTPRYVDKVFTFKVEEARHVLRVAYACTAHKCQGQEFDYILMPMTMQYGIMLYRNLIYTAITRAKKKVFVFGDPNAFSYAVSNDRETVRNSALMDLISDAIANGVDEEIAEAV